MKKETAELLLQNPMVRAWIHSYRQRAHTHEECMHCGWPHDKHIMCGWGATFGCVKLGGELIAIDASNVEYLITFLEKFPSGFHWRDEIFIDVLDGQVMITYLTVYNNTPSWKVKKIPMREWQSISEYVEKNALRTSESDPHPPCHQ